MKAKRALAQTRETTVLSSAGESTEVFWADSWKEEEAFIPVVLLSCVPDCS